MIIISQEKHLLNYNNVIEICKTFGNEKDVSIIATTINDDIVLGEYDTEERADEVLQEIIKVYIESKKAQETTSMFGFSIIPSNTYYEMPKE